MLLIGNTYPLALIRRPVTIQPRPLESLTQALATQPYLSFWGHSNTTAAAKTFTGIDLTPTQERPAIVLNSENLPSLNGHVFREVWILSPDYAPGFRPAINQEVSTENILGWQVLQITFA